MLILSRLHLNDLNIPKDTTKAKFIKYLSDKTVVFNNLVITGLLLFRTHGCEHYQASQFSKFNRPIVFLISNCMQQVTVDKNLSPSLRYNLVQLKGNSCSSTSLKKRQGKLD